MSFNPGRFALDEPLGFDDSSVRSARRSPKRLQVELLDGLVVGLGVDLGGNLASMARPSPTSG